MKRLLIVVFALLVCTAAFAQTNGTPVPQLPGDPADWKTIGAFWGAVIAFLMAAGRIIQAFRTGTSIFSGLFGGTNKPVDKPPTT